MNKRKLLEIYKNLPGQLNGLVKHCKKVFLKLYYPTFTLLGKLFFNPIKLAKNKNKEKRFLEIGPGSKRLKGFETLNIVGGLNVDYVYDAAKPLPFKNNTFNLVYASHVLEHIPWYQTKEVLEEWVRILKLGGHLEIWVPDGFKICEGIIKAEKENENITYKDGWYKFNPDKNPYVWANGRIFTYGDGTGRINHPNWHRALFTSTFLKSLMKSVGLVNLEKMSNEEVYGHDHGWISLGIKGTKK